MGEKRTYHFYVTELTERTASVEAESAAEARRLLRLWASPGQGGGGLCYEEGGPILLNDIEPLRFTFRNTPDPTLQAQGEKTP